MTGNKGQNAIKFALKSGYQLLDTATLYNNEREIGNAIKESNIPRLLHKSCSDGIFNIE